MIEAFCTAIQPPTERAEYWRDAVRRAFTRLEIHSEGAAELHGAIRRACMAGVQVGSLEASPQQLARTAPLIAADGDTSLLVSLQHTGDSIAVQDGRETLVAAGQLVILDSRRPYTLAFADPVRQHLATVPRQMLDLPDSLLRQATMRTYSVGHGIGGILASYVDGLVTADHCICA
ncbi:cupin domain-containing protein, partial [Actinacidiphila sp. bgisy160]|uniref:cupin domain-containing protein n=1 Tax=Actinacidiphila sp. bgisy160 TaxID=3413796 RepID=UPI003D759B40